MEDVEENPQAETTEVNTEVITSTIESAINSLDDNSIVDAGTELAKSTNASNTQSVSQDESIPIDTFDELEHSHQEAAAFEDIFDRQHDDASTVTARSDVENTVAPPTNVNDVLIENSPSMPDAELHVAEQSHQEAVAADSEPGALEDIFNKKQDDRSMVGSGIGDPMEILASSEKQDIWNDNKEEKIDQPQTKATGVALGAGVPLPIIATKQTVENRGIIDTAAPFESVKEAVSKFGGIVDWKSHKMQTVERRKEVHEELQKAKEEIFEYQKRSDTAEQAKFQVLEELDSTKRLIEILKLNIERAEIEESQARQDSELAKLRVKEMEQGVAEVSSFASRAQLAVAKARYTAAITELTSVKEELEELRKGFFSAVTEKDGAVKKAEEAITESKQVEKIVENLTIELLSTKESLESAHIAHMEAEEHRIGTAMGNDQDFLNQKNLFVEDLKSKLSKASTLLHDLKAELNAYTESKGDIEIEDIQTHNEIQAAVASAKKELEEVKLRIEKSVAEVNYLKVAATSLRSEIEQEKSSSLASLRQRGEILELPKKLEHAAEEANKANLLAQAAREEMERVKEDAEQAMADASTMQSRLASAQKEIEAARASARLAMAAIKALQESETARNNNEVDSSNFTALSMEEYYQLSKQVHEAEQQANLRVAAANYEIEIAKESELKILEKLNEVNKEMAERRQSLKNALDKAEKARNRKLSVEGELGKWSAEQEQRRKDGEIGQRNKNSSHSSNFPVHGLSSSKTGKKKQKKRTLYTISLAINYKN